MDFQEYEMIMMSIVEKAEPRSKSPLARVITIAASRQKATELANQELDPYKSGRNDYSSQIKNLGSILFPPIPTIVFLYTREAGHIK